MHYRSTVCLLLATTLGLAACGSSSSNDSSSTGAPRSSTTTTTATTAASAAPVIDPGDHGDYRPSIDPANFVTVIDNPYFPLPVGARWVYRGEEGGDVQVDEMTVTPDHKTIMGVTTVVVRDTLRDGDGNLIEDTFDWYAQDRAGNVWYFGEGTKEYENGKVTSTEGSWEGGVDGALPGIIMPAKPTVGDAYRQEYDHGNAEDLAVVVRTGQRATTPAGTYTNVLVTKEWTPLEPKLVEEKFYAPGVGNVSEKVVRGGNEVTRLTESSGLTGG
jgi:hypothetical protein